MELEYRSCLLSNTSGKFPNLVEKEDGTLVFDSSERGIEYVYTFHTTPGTGNLTISVRDLGNMETNRSMTLDKEYLEGLRKFIEDPEFFQKPKTNKP